ncbi:HD domain-containing phosphohydrolase [Vibrio scophthalmi]|uniref:HD-GYP domain-containing protein n=1 Tax=Vibrio scophthalmi TaxID=45658 RepID=UPI003872FD80
MMNNRYFQTTKPLNEQLEQLMQRMHIRVPAIARVSYAKYCQESDTLVTYADSEFDLWSELHHEQRLRKLNHLKETAHTAIPRIIDDLRQITHCERVNLLTKKGYRSSAAIPCYHQRKLSGFIFLNAYETGAFDKKSLAYLEPYLEMVQFTVESQCQVVEAIVKLAERVKTGAQLYGQDEYYHGRRMRLYTHIVAEALAERHQLDDEQVDAISLFAQFHDIGKTQVAESTPCNSDPLSSSVTLMAQNYIDQGVKIMEEIVASVGEPNHPSIQLLNQIMRFQSERLDGSGYPYGFHGDEIPLSARMVAVASCFDSMTTDKHDRQALSVPSALLELEKQVQRGKLDGECVNALRHRQEYLKQVIRKFPEPMRWGNML